MCVLVVQSCPTLWDPVDCSLPGSSIQRILQATILEWVAIPHSRGSSWPRDQTWVSCTAGRFLTIWATKEVPQTVDLQKCLKANIESFSLSFSPLTQILDFLDGSVVKNPLAKAGDTGDVGSIPGSGKSPGEGNDNSLQWEYTRDRGARRITVQEVTKRWTWLRDRAHLHAHPNINIFHNHGACIGTKKLILVNYY